jgi:hypothetical protein
MRRGDQFGKNGRQNKPAAMAILPPAQTAQVVLA